MKHAILFLSAILLNTALLAQPHPGAPSAVNPSRGYYRQVATYDPAPKAARAELDKLTFFRDEQGKERRLSLKPVFLTEIKDDFFVIPPPPANSSARTRAEINYLLALQRTRTAEEVRASLYMANVYYNLRVMPSDSTYTRYRKNLFHIGRSIGTWFNPDDLPLTAELMAKVWRDASYFTWYLKFKYARVRPYTLEPKLKNLEETNWEAYPSGHAANSYVNALVYSKLAPEYEDVFMKDAYDMAHSREILGVHFPTDAEASLIMARQLVDQLFLNAAFLAEFKGVKTEWAAKAKEKLD